MHPLIGDFLLVYFGRLYWSENNSNRPHTFGWSKISNIYLHAFWRLSSLWSSTCFSFDFTWRSLTTLAFFLRTSRVWPLKCEAQNEPRTTVLSGWNVHITSLILEATLLVQSKTALIFLAVRSHYWPTLNLLTTLTPQAFHINCSYTQLPLPAHVPFGPKGRTLHLFQLNFILLNPVHHFILSKMPGALIRFFKIYAVLPQVSTHQSTHIWMPFLCQLCSQYWGFRDV